MKPVVLLAAVLLAAGAASCSSPNPGRPGHAAGPPNVRPRTVFGFGRVFDDSFNPRPPGSQKELLASSYLTAHMARLGYVLRLDSVPVADSVASGNVEAFPHRAPARPSAVVTVAYDTPPGGSDEGASLGEWLEIGRALEVRGAADGVELVALGAEHARVSGGQLGSRRLAQVLLDEKATPQVITIGTIGRSRTFSALGPAAPALDAIARKLGIPLRRGVIAGPSAVHPDVWAEAGFHHTTIAGGAGATGRVLLRFLAARGTSAAPG